MGGVTGGKWSQVGLAVMLAAIEWCHRIAVLERDRIGGPCFRSLRSCCFESCLSLWWSLFNART